MNHVFRRVQVGTFAALLAMTPVLAVLPMTGCGNSREVVVEDEPSSPEAEQMLEMQKQMFRQQTQGPAGQPQQPPQ